MEAVPDLRMEVVSTTTEGDRCGVQWRLRGTFAGPGTLGGVAPTGSPIDLEGFDLVTVRDGLIPRNDAFTDNMTFARQIGMMPPQDSAAEQRMTAPSTPRRSSPTASWRATPSWWPRACGSCRASPRAATSI